MRRGQPALAEGNGRRIHQGWARFGPIPLPETRGMVILNNAPKASARAPFATCSERAPSSPQSDGTRREWDTIPFFYFRGQNPLDPSIASQFSVIPVMAMIQFNGRKRRRQ